MNDADIQREIDNEIMQPLEDDDDVVNTSGNVETGAGLAGRDSHIPDTGRGMMESARELDGQLKLKSK